MTAGVNYSISIEYNGNQTGANNFTAIRINLDTGAVNTVTATANTSAFSDLVLDQMFKSTSTAGVSDCQQWNQRVILNGVLVRYYPLGVRGICVVSGDVGTITNVAFTGHSDFACFYAEEYGFAVKSGVIYPALLDGTGYAGLVGTADKYFPKGLISRRGSVDIEAWNYLDTLIDFGGSAGVLSAGIIINQFDGTDCNDDLITTAEPKLDPAEITILAPASGDDIELDKNFTVSGTSNCANVKIEASADGSTWVVLAASVAVTAGAFSKANCQLPSTDFDPNDEITIRVSDVDSISSPDTVAIDTIATIVINEPESSDEIPVGSNYEISGTSNSNGVDVYVNDSLTYQLPVVEGAYSKTDCTFASTGEKTIRVEDPDNNTVYKEVVVEAVSGVVLTALQITNADDATDGDTHAAQCEFDGDNIIVGGITNSTKLRIGSNTYPTGYTSIMRYWIASITKSHIVNWIKFFDYSISGYSQGDNAFCVDTDGIVILDIGTSGGNTVTTARKLSKTDGSTLSSIALTTAGSRAWGTCIGKYNNKYWVIGQTVPAYNWELTTWELELDLSGQTKRTPSGADTTYLLSAKVFGQYVYCVQTAGYTYRLDLSANSRGTAYSTTNVQKASVGVSATRMLASGMKTLSPAKQILNMRSLNLATSHFERNVVDSTSAYYIGCCNYDDKFLHFYANITNFKIDKVDDSNTYTAVNHTTITPNAITAGGYINGFTSCIAFDSTHYLICASLTGNMEAGFVPGNSAKFDGFIKLIEKV